MGKLELIVKKWNGPKKKKGVRKKIKKTKGFPKYPPFPKHKLIHKCAYCKSKFKAQVIGSWNPDVGPRCLKCLRKGKGEERIKHRRKRTIKFAMD